MEVILTFISSVLSSISWPLAGVVIVLLLRKPLAKLLSRIGKVKYGDFEADFSKGLEEVNKKINELPEGNTIRVGGTANVVVHYNKSLSEEVDDIAKISPEAAIPYAWSRIEYALHEKSEKLESNETGSRMYSPTKIADMLYKDGKIESSALSVIQTMGKLRNAVVHKYYYNGEISYFDANEYGKNAEKIINILSNIT